MKIKYLDCKGEHKLFSFHTHHYNTWESPSGEFYMLDGGGEAYFRYSHPDLEKPQQVTKDSVEQQVIKEDEISNLIVDIREQFTWGQNYDKGKELLPKTVYRKLKDISDSHLIALVEYWRERGNLRNLEIFEAEVGYRLIHDIQVPDYE